MASNYKNIMLSYIDSGVSIYCIIMHEVSGNKSLQYFDYNDGTFKATPTTPATPLTEDSIMKGIYRLAENRASWESGKYTILFYLQAGVSPASTTDTKIAVDKQDFLIEFDALV